MNKQSLCWLPVIKKNVRGENYALSYPDVIAACYQGTLLEEILKMPEGNPISFERAVVIAHDQHIRAFKSSRIGNAVGECHWYQSHFVEWLSSLGLQIILTGDEFEPWLAPENVI